MTPLLEVTILQKLKRKEVPLLKLKYCKRYRAPDSRYKNGPIMWSFDIYG